MEKVLNVAVGGRSFVIEEDAYREFSGYLDAYREKVKMGIYTGEVMNDIEDRAAELFQESLRNGRNVVTMSVVRDVISRLGLPDGDSFRSGDECQCNGTMEVKKKFYRDPDDRIFGGVCSGMALYFGLDTLLIRVLMVILLIFGGSGFWLYLIFWFVAPMARTAAQKCEMRGIPVTVENMKRFYNNQ